MTDLTIRLGTEDPDLRAKSDRHLARRRRWERFGWSRRWGPLSGGPLDHPVVVGLLLPLLSPTVQPRQVDTWSCYLIQPPGLAYRVMLHPKHGLLYWCSEGWPPVADFGLIALWAWCRDCCFAVAASDLRLALAAKRDSLTEAA